MLFLKAQIMQANENISNFKVRINVTDFFSLCLRLSVELQLTSTSNACVATLQTICLQLISQVDNWTFAKHLKTVLESTKFRFKYLGWKLISVACKTIFWVSSFIAMSLHFLFTKMGPIVLNPHFCYLE